MDNPDIWGYVPAEFINRETHIKISELVEELLKNQLLKAVSEEYDM